MRVLPVHRAGEINLNAGAPPAMSRTNGKTQALRAQNAGSFKPARAAAPPHSQTIIMAQRSCQIVAATRVFHLARVMHRVARTVTIIRRNGTRSLDQSRKY
jgi:hypothetical protein